MKKLLSRLFVGAAVASTGTATAADLSKALPPLFGWSGCYAGGARKFEHVDSICRELIHLSRAEPSQPRQLEGGPPEIDTGDGAENIDFDSFYPSHHQSRIYPKIDPNSATGGCHPDPAPLDRKILADCCRAHPVQSIATEF